jgi:hypothetical protein
MRFLLYGDLKSTKGIPYLALTDEGFLPIAPRRIASPTRRAFHGQRIEARRANAGA